MMFVPTINGFCLNYYPEADVLKYESAIVFGGKDSVVFLIEWISNRKSIV